MTRCTLRTSILLPLVLLSLNAAACSKDGESSPTSPTPATVTDTFSSTIAQLGSTTHAFSVTSTGPLTVSLTEVGPLATMSLGVAITGATGSTCNTSTIAKTDNARAGATALSGTATAGAYCVSVYDSGNVAEGSTVSYTVNVVHP